MKRKYTLLGAGLLLLFFIVWFVAASALGSALLGSMMAGRGMNQYMMYLVLGASELLLIAPLAIYMAVTGTGPKALLGNRTHWRQNVPAVLTGVLMVPALLGLSAVTDALFRWLGARPVDTSYMDPRGVGQLLAGFVAVGATAGIVEEPLFRGVVLRGLGSVASRRAAVAVTALLFSFVHLDVVGALPRFVIGLVLGYMAWRAGSILPGILAHAAFNCTSLCVSLFAGKLLSDWPGLFGSLPPGVNGAVSWALISLPFIPLTVAAYRAFARATPESAAWGDKPYAAAETRASHYVPIALAGAAILVMTALFSLTMWLKLPDVSQFFR